MLALGITGSANITNPAVTPTGGAVFSSVKDDLQVKIIPALSGKCLFKVTLGLNNMTATGQSPALGQSVNMGIDRKAGYAKGLSHDHASGFMADPWQCFKNCHIGRDGSTVILDQDFT
jgi:hypothetical protein